ncbi:hypothetical protein B005_2940 [Nocardiopsis alba ATCC BAA-2165]|uniref:Uncharacterized protein n=1 Tax=Nocardiopsis alba (strain ATCC BAA-2165 / BE74) TaxID=1205910 RepID=J7LFL0_NOCAA|nr:hypothetical protein B005_2940 [Nocardiopsis alba ATCC BAA-2165]
MQSHAVPLVEGRSSRIGFFPTTGEPNKSDGRAYSRLDRPFVYRRGLGVLLTYYMGGKRKSKDRCSRVCTRLVRSPQGLPASNRPG